MTIPAHVNKYTVKSTALKLAQTEDEEADRACCLIWRKPYEP
jgi:hypothetical protein